jgi:CDGSH-type Zn-finger protein
MSDVTIKTREHGPLLVTGAVTIIDHLGNKYDTTGKETIALCRCGASTRRPFCDGTHKSTGFQACETAPVPPGTAPVAPQ